MAKPESFKVGEAPWEQQGSESPHADSFPVGSAPWESQSSSKIDYGDMANTALESLGKGISAGYLPQIQAGVEKATDLIGEGKDKLLAAAGLENLTSTDYQLRKQGFDIPVQTYVQIRDQNLARQAGQKERNPWTAGISELAGGIAGGSAMGAGAAKFLPAMSFSLIDKATRMSPAIAEVAASAPKIARIASAGEVGTIYGALSNPGDVQGEVSPIQLGERVGNAGMGLVTGSALGTGIEGAASAIKYGSDKYNSALKSLAEMIVKRKPNADEVMKEAAKLGVEATPGMLNDSNAIRTLESSLSDSPSLVTWFLRRNINRIKDAASKVAGEAVKDANGLTAYQAGDIAKKQVANKIEENFAPSVSEFEDLKKFTKDIPSSEKSIAAVSRNIMNIPEVAILDNSPAANVAKSVVRALEKNPTADGIKTIRTMVGNEARALDKSMSGVDTTGHWKIYDKLGQLEENTIKRGVINDNSVMKAKATTESRRAIRQAKIKGEVRTAQELAVAPKQPAPTMNDLASGKVAAPEFAPKPVDKLAVAHGELDKPVAVVKSGKYQGYDPEKQIIDTHPYINQENKRFARDAGVEIDFLDGAGSRKVNKPHIMLKDPTNAELTSALEQAEKDGFQQIIIDSKDYSKINSKVPQKGEILTPAQSRAIMTDKDIIKAIKKGGVNAAEAEKEAQRRGIAKDMIAQLKRAKAGYAEQMSKLQDVADTNRLPRVKTKGTFVESITGDRGIKSENMGKKFFNVADNRGRSSFKETFPEASNTLRGQHLQELRDAVTFDGKLHADVLLKKIEKLEPEAINDLFNEVAPKLKGLQVLKEAASWKFNPSETAKAITWSSLSDMATKQITDIGRVAIYKGLSSEYLQRLGQAMKQAPVMANLAEKNPEAFRIVVANFARKLSDGGFSQKLVADKKPETKKGYDAWARNGFENIIEHENDPVKLQKYMDMEQELLRSKKGRDLLVKASDLKPGTKAMQNLLNELDKTRGE